MHFRFFNHHQTIYCICNCVCNFFTIHNICNQGCFTNELSFPFCHSQSCHHIVVDSLNDSPTLMQCPVLSDSLWLHMTVARQAPLSMGFPRQEYWSGLPFPSPGDLPDPGIESESPASADGFFATEPPGKPCIHVIISQLASCSAPAGPFPDFLFH